MILMKPLAIIALDPGATSAFCALDLQGQVLRIFSAKELSLSNMISRIIEVCQPVIAVTDKAKLPSLVDEFSRKLGTRLVVPEEDLTREEKRVLIKEYFSEEESELYQNTHEFDCLSTALYAYKKYLPRMKKINEFIVQNKLEEQKEEFTALAIKEPDLSFNVVKELLLPEEENKIVREVILEERITKKNFLQSFAQLSQSKKNEELLHNKIKELYKKINERNKENSFLNKRNSNVEGRIDRLFKVKEDRLNFLEQRFKAELKRNEQLRQEINYLYHFIERVPRFQLLKKLDSLTQKEFEEKNKVLEIKEGDFLLLGDPNTYSEKIIVGLLNKNITLCSTQKISKFLKSNFATILLSLGDLVHSNQYFGLAKVELLRQKLSEKEMLQEVIKEYQESRKDRRSQVSPLPR